MISNDDKLLLVGKILVSDMDDLARERADAPVFFGMGLALNRVYCVLRQIPFSEIPRIVPKDMMTWVREQPINGKTNLNSKQLMELL